MAVITATKEKNFSHKTVTWTPLATGDTGSPWQVTDNVDGACVQFSGTFLGSTVVLQGSNDGTNYVTLKDNTGNAVTATAAAYFDLPVNMEWVRPSVSAGTATTITAVLRMRMDDSL